MVALFLPDRARRKMVVMRVLKFPPGLGLRTMRRPGMGLRSGSALPTTAGRAADNEYFIQSNANQKWEYVQRVMEIADTTV
jgi:hypothetical protein